VTSPFSLGIELINGMINFELAGNPHYQGLEIQVFDDPVHGTGMLVLLSRASDGRIDVYRQPGLRVDPSGYQIAGGLGEWVETAIQPAYLSITPFGVQADVCLTDTAGRVIEVLIDDHSRHMRRRGSMLAPMGAAIEHPTSLPLVWMTQFDLVRRSRREPLIRIAGQPATTGRLPGAALHRRHLIKYAADLCVLSINPAHDGPVEPVDPAHVVLADNRVAAVTATQGTRRGCLRLAPGLPDMTTMPLGATARGSWSVDIDDTSNLTGGTWSALRHQAAIDLAFDVTQPWRPFRLPALMKVVTTVMPLFRTWPATYRWTGRLSVGDRPVLSSRWERKTDQRAAGYRRLTRSA
jgi:hypothetical protein